MKSTEQQDSRVPCDSEEDLKLASLGFNSENVLLYRFINAYLNVDVDAGEEHFDFREIFEHLVPMRLFVDIPEFLMQLSKNSNRTFISDLPVFKKLKLGSRNCDEEYIANILPRFEDDYKQYIANKDMFRFPRATFQRVLEILLNPIEQLRGFEQYRKTLEKLFIPLDIATNCIEIHYSSGRWEHLLERRRFLGEKMGDSTLNNTKTIPEQAVKPKLQVWLKPKDAKEVTEFVNELRKIMAASFGYDVPAESSDENSNENSNENSVSTSHDSADGDHGGVIESMKKLGNRVLDAYTEFAKLQDSDGNWRLKSERL